MGTKPQYDIRVLLHDIRSAHNVGSIFRTGDAAGVTRIYCSGFTARPVDRFKRAVKEIAKTALGAEMSVPWEDVPDPLALIARLKGEGFAVVGIEQDERATDYKAYRLPERTLLLVGSEVEGLSVGLRNACDVLLEIPMGGTKESLNVSVAFGIALFRITEQK
jgi:tRNA G18 (ribose-2'-O)-methylase SpoU